MAVVALIGDDRLQARLIMDNLRSAEHNVVWAKHSWAGLLLAFQIRPDLIVVDCDVFQWDELLTLMSSMPSLRDTPRILIGSYCPPEYYLRKFGVVSCMERYLDAEALVQQVQNALKRPTLGACEVAGED